MRRRAEITDDDDDGDDDGLDDDDDAILSGLATQDHFSHLVVRPRPNAGQLRYRFKWDKNRSRAYPAFPAEDRPQLSAADGDKETDPLGAGAYDA